MMVVNSTALGDTNASTPASSSDVPDHARRRRLGTGQSAQRTHQVRVRSNEEDAAPLSRTNAGGELRFKPTEAVRSFGQIVGHLADAHYYRCSALIGEKNPSLKIEETKSAKADLIAALTDALAYCDTAYDGMTDASATQMVKLSGFDMPKLGVLNINGIHAGVHYGNFVTYLRLKNIVPPTSEPGFRP